MLRASVSGNYPGFWADLAAMATSALDSKAAVRRFRGNVVERTLRILRVARWGGLLQAGSYRRAPTGGLLQAGSYGRGPIVSPAGAGSYRWGFTGGVLQAGFYRWGSTGGLLQAGSCRRALKIM